MSDGSEQTPQTRERWAIRASEGALTRTDVIRWAHELGIDIVPSKVAAALEVLGVQASSEGGGD